MTTTRPSAESARSPRVTVCVPVYNAATWLAETIASVQRQTFTDWELVGVDNQSTDGSLDVLREIADPRIRIYRNPVNVGHAANFNQALSLASSPLVKILCADDLLAPEYLERAVELFDGHANVGMVFCRRTLRWSGGRPSDALVRHKARYESMHCRFGELEPINSGAALFERYLAARFDDNWIGEPSIVILRRELLAAIGMFHRRIRRANDMDLWIRALRFTDVGFLDAELATFRQHEDTLTSTQRRSHSWWLDRLWLVEGLLSPPQAIHSTPRLRRLRRLERLRVLARMPMVLGTDPERTARVQELRAYLRYRRAQLQDRQPDVYGRPTDHPPALIEPRPQ